jgi:hypothetical protein
MQLLAAFALLTSGPGTGWCSRVFGDLVTGQITATPLSGKIEVDHHIYRIKPGSTAEQALHGFSEGQRVDLVLDGPPAGKESAVLKITLHAS